MEVKQSKQMEEAAPGIYPRAVPQAQALPVLTCGNPTSSEGKDKHGYTHTVHTRTHTHFHLMALHRFYFILCFVTFDIAQGQALSSITITDAM